MIHRLTAGQPLQPALDRLAPGDELQLEAGATWAGLFELPAMPLHSLNTLSGKGILQSTVPSQPALKTRPGAHGWHLREFIDRPLGASEVLRLGSGTHTLEEVPRGLVLDGLTLECGAAGLAHRGISLNSADTVIRNCTIRDIHAPGLETGGIIGWNTPGNLLIENNDIQAASIPFMMGGTPPSIPDLVPTNIVFRNNRCHRPVSWRAMPWVCKNLFELKNASDVRVYGNTFEHNWAQGQNGYAIVLTPRAGGNAPWTRVTNVRFYDNVIRHSGAGINLLGTDTNWPSQPMSDIQIYDNQFLDIDAKWGTPTAAAPGRAIQMVNEPHGVRIERNLFINSGQALFIDSSRNDGVREPVQRVVLRWNEFRNGQIRGNGTLNNVTTVATYLPDAEILHNTFAGERHPGDHLQLHQNQYPTREEFDAQYLLAGEVAERRPSREMA